MQHFCRFLNIFLVLVFPVIWQVPGITASAGERPPETDNISTIIGKVSPRLQQELSEKGLILGSPIFIRIFKIPGELEVWVEKQNKYQFFKSYPICSYSGYPGPKQYEGDWQSPEGFYTVTARQMNPSSNYHLALNIGYPNDFDKALNRTGSNIMIHGDCSSRGCFAMNDYRIEEIYILIHTSLLQGQETISVHIFPFRLTSINLYKFRSSPWINFWNNLREGYDAFEQRHQVPNISTSNEKYIVDGNIKLAMSPQKR